MTAIADGSVFTLKAPTYTAVNRRRGGSRLFVYLAVDAILTMSLVAGGIAILGSHRPAFASSTTLSPLDKAMLEHSGAVKLSASALINHVSLPFHHGTRYWLGPKDGYSYTTTCINPGELAVTYYQPGQSVNDLTATHLKVAVYENEAYFDEHLQPISASTSHSLVNNRGDIITFDPTDSRAMKISQLSSGVVILISYPTPQNLSSLLADSQNVMPLPASPKMS